MASRKIKLISTLSIAVLAAGGYLVYSAFAVQGQGILAQEPLNLETQVTPAFIMAVDNSGSMSFQHQFPAADGYGCWDTASASFFSGANLRTSGSCRYAYSYTSHRIGWEYHGIPPVDRYGFSRSAQYNPSYFNPQVVYQPWVTSTGDSYPAASTAAAGTRQHPDTATATTLINLTSNLARTNADSEFFAYRGMTLPEGMRYRMVGTGNAERCINSGLENNTDWHTIPAGGYIIPANAYTQSDVVNRRGCRLYIEHWPATFFMPYTAATDPWPELDGSPGVYNATSSPRTLAVNACGTGCNLWKYTIQSGTAAHQNFANWFSFYGNRNRAMIAGMTQSMAAVNNMRVGYFRINDYGIFDEPLSKPAERLVMRDMQNANDRIALYSQMRQLNIDGSTPNRHSVYAAGQQFMRNDDGAPVQLACQRNAIMLFTDGFSNEGDAPNIAAPTNRDGDLGAPFRDGHSHTMADIATIYYQNNAGASPIRPDLPAGQVRAPSACPTNDPKINCQVNQHVTFYGITLGGRGNLFDPDNILDPYTTPAIYNNWPARANNNRSTVDDIWHATVNTRGELVNARTPADITSAMRRILGAVAEGSTPAGSIGVTGARIGTGSLSVEPFYESTNFATDWYSELTARRPSTDPLTGEIIYTTAWEASERLPAPDDRNVWYSRGATFAQFTPSAGLTLGNLCSSPAPFPLPLCQADEITSRMGVNIAGAITYLLGDQTNEEGRTGGTGKLRYRTTRLGSIINSAPVISAPTDDFGFRALMSTDPTPVPDRFNYAAYLETKATRRPMVYVGANDGMLHAFDGRTGAEGGIERFAYIPSTALGHMGNLLIPLAGKENDPDFKHRYFVDGPITVSDAYRGVAWGGGGAGWKTVLVGTAGAGGRSVFALNVSNPAEFGAGHRLWELGPHSPAEISNDLGYVLGKPVVVPVKTRGGTVRWKAIFGNGYNSPNGNVVLFVVDIADGTVQRIQANESGAPTAGTNGLGNIIAVDRYSGPDATLDVNGRDGYADTVYAADQKGALWRFDLRDGTPSSLTTPVFVTNTLPDGSRQPITGGLTAALAPGGGVMVYFGTGSFSFLGDKEDLTVQSLYGVIDRGLSTTLTRSVLTQQTVTVGAPGSTARVVSRNLMVAGNSGWYLDLPAGERMVAHPRVENGIVFLPTYDPVTSQGCSGQGNNWLYGLNALSGGAALSGVSVGSPTGDPYGSTTGAVALETGGTAPVKEVAVLTSPRLPPLAAGATDEELDAALAMQCSMLVQVAGAPPLYMPRACGRQSWRQIR